MMEDTYRKISKQIAPLLLKKGYYRDIQNNIFIKKCSNHFYDFNEIRFYKEYIIISNLHSRSIHKTNIDNLINWMAIQEFKDIINNYLKMLKINE